jgi:hypothetical protein
MGHGVNLGFAGGSNGFLALLRRFGSAS